MCCDWAAAQQPMLRHMCTAVTAELSCQIFGLITELHESHLARSALHLQMHSTSTLCNDLRNRITASSCLSGTLQFTLGKAPSHICHTLSVSRLPGASSLLPFDRSPSMGSLNCHADETQHSIAGVKYCRSSQFPHFGGSAACNHLLKSPCRSTVVKLGMAANLLSSTRSLCSHVGAHGRDARLTSY